MALTPKTILVPIDFSPTSECALGLAGELAGAFEAEIHLLHVRATLDNPIMSLEDLDEVKHVRAMADARVQQALEKSAHGIDAPTHCHVCREAVPADAIIEAVSEHNCDLVIMGTNGRRGLKRLLTGSVAQEVVHHSPVPVLTIRVDADDPCLPQKILVAVDFSETSIEAVEWAATVAPALDAEITLLHVVETLIYPDFYALDSLPEVRLKEVTSHCHRSLSDIAKEYLANVPSTTAVIQAHPAQGIASFAEENDHDLVVLATKGLSGVTHALFGSVAERLVRLSEVPVLTVRGIR